MPQIEESSSHELNSYGIDSQMMMIFIVIGGGSRGGARAPISFLVKKEEMTEGRKAG